MDTGKSLKSYNLFNLIRPSLSSLKLFKQTSTTGVSCLVMAELEWHLNLNSPIKIIHSNIFIYWRIFWWNQWEFGSSVSFISVVTNPKLSSFFAHTFLSIFSTSLYFQAVPSQAENRFLNRQGSGDRAENHYWPHLGSIATAMASQDNRIESVMDTKA